MHIRPVMQRPMSRIKSFRFVARQPLPKEYWEHEPNAENIEKEEEGRDVTWNELFYDLAYVAIVASLGHNLAHHPSLGSLGEFIVLFAVVWMTWSDTVVYINHFESEDIVHKLFFFGEMLSIVGFGINAETAFSARLGAVGWACSFALSRLSFAAVYAYVAVKVKVMRVYCSVMACRHIPTISLWFAGAFVDDLNARKALFITAVILEFILAFGTPYLMAVISSKIGKKEFQLRRSFDIEHLVERFGLFTILVLGEMMTSLLAYSIKELSGLYTYLASFCGLTIAFGLEWIYFDVEAERQQTHAVERSWQTGLCWYVLHFPLALTIILTSSGMRNVLGHIMLEDEFHSSVADAWFLCAGLGLTFIIIGLIGLLHHSAHGMRIRWEIRVAFRILIGILCIVTPLFGVSDTGLVAVLTGFTVLLVIFEIYGTLNKPEGHRHFWSGQSTSNLEKRDESKKNHMHFRATIEPQKKQALDVVFQDTRVYDLEK
eukprot:TRINITY_DN918_c0_g1_i1.p1 TRINITY_DN918_c0_g1~~TRINITY_DN918_c0_g1_i1.p1  ORF type:complete len:488 (+),score=106.25 TRINITY_DN918_c0_g1_i1:115-1578(+)